MSRATANPFVNMPNRGLGRVGFARTTESFTLIYKSFTSEIRGVPHQRGQRRNFEVRFQFGERKVGFPTATFEPDWMKRFCFRYNEAIQATSVRP